MTPLSERPFSALAENWSYEFDGTPETIVRDSSAPHSPPGVIQFRYAAGRRGGNSQGNDGAIRWEPKKTIYVYLAWKIDSNWQGHASGVNKQFFLTVNNPNGGAGNQTFFDAHGMDAGGLQLQIQAQRHCCGSAFLRYPPNVRNGALSRGRWHELEFFFDANTPGVRDGLLRVWKDGEMTHDYSDFGPLDADEGPGFSGVFWSSIWGGTGDVIEHDQYIWLDHIYISGS